MNNSPEPKKPAARAVAARRRLLYWPSLSSWSALGSLVRDPLAWIYAVASFLFFSTVVARTYGSWTVLISEGFVLPIGLAAVAIALAGVARRHVDGDDED